MPNALRPTYVVVRTASPNDATEIEVRDCLTSLVFARRTALHTARNFRGCRVSIDKYDGEGHYLGEVDSCFLAPATTPNAETPNDA